MKSLEEAGAWAVDIEVIPTELLTEISKRTSLATTSIHAGSGGDIQFMFAEDILGTHEPPDPRHTKQYRDFYKLEQDLREERVGGFRGFIQDVKSGAFPEAKHVVNAPDGLIERFLVEADQTHA